MASCFGLDLDVDFDRRPSMDCRVSTPGIPPSPPPPPSSSSTSSRMERGRSIYFVHTSSGDGCPLKELHFPSTPVVFPMGASYRSTWNTPTAFLHRFCFNAGHHTPCANCTRVWESESSWKPPPKRCSLEAMKQNHMRKPR